MIVLNQEFAVPVVDALTGTVKRAKRIGRDGSPVEIVRFFRASPFPVLYPGEQIIIIDWARAIKAITKSWKDESARLKAKGETPPDYDVELRRRIKEYMLRPIEFNGMIFYGYFMWGSGVKKSQTIGLTHDLCVESGLVQGAEDCVRGTAMLLPSANYGGGFFDGLKVLVVNDKTVVFGHMVADGAGLIAEDIANAMRAPDSWPIKLGLSHNNALVWQRFRWDKIQPEAEPLILNNLDSMGSMEWQLREIDRSAATYKRALIEADPQMAYHPYCTYRIVRGVRRQLVELNSTVPLDFYTRIAVPTALHEYVMQDDVYDTHFIVTRWPADSWQSTTGEKASKSEAYLREQQRIFRPYVQIRLNSRTHHGKDVCGVTPREEMGGYDLVMTNEDFKVIAGQPDIRKWRKSCAPRFEMRLKDVVISMTQWYEPGCAVGCPVDEWKKKGGDYDGDPVFIAPCSDLPLIWAEAASFKSHNDNTYKLEKSSAPLERRVEMIVDNMSNEIGFATNVMADTFTVYPDDRQSFAQALYEAIPPQEHGMEAPEIWALDRWLNKVVKLCTDGFKVPTVDMVGVRAWLWKAQRAVGRTAAWLLWARDDDPERELAGAPAFEKMIPEFVSEMTPEQLRYADQHEKYRRGLHWRCNIPPEHEDATIAQIYRITRPWTVAQFDVQYKRDKPSYLAMLQTKDLSTFLSWVPHVSNKDIEEGREMVQTFAKIANTVSWENEEAVLEFKESWQIQCNAWAKKWPSRQHAVYVMWSASHHMSSSDNSAGAVFMAFPVECLDIVRNKPGRVEEAGEPKVILITGMDWNFSVTPPNQIDNVMVRLELIRWKGEEVTIAVSVDDLPGQRPERPPMPAKILGFLQGEGRGGFWSVPPPGVYLAKSIKRAKTGKSYVCHLVPVDVFEGS